MNRSVRATAFGGVTIDSFHSMARRSAADLHICEHVPNVFVQIFTKSKLRLQVQPSNPTLSPSSHPGDEVSIAGFNTRWAVPQVLLRLVLPGELAIAPNDKALVMENPGALVAADHLAVLAAAAALFRDVK